MKKILVLLGILLGMGAADVFAFQSTVWLSSNVPTQVSTSTLCGNAYVINGTTTELRGVLHGVCVNTAASGNVQVFSSSFSAIGSLTGVYSTGTQIPCNFYDTESTNGLSYNKNGTADVTILYQCY